MIAPFAFLILAACFMLAGHFAVQPAAWPRRAPRLAIALWQALSGATVVSLLLACVSVTLPGMSAAATLSEALHACATELQHQYSSPGGALVSTTGMSVLAFLSFRLIQALWINHRTTRRSRREHLATLRLIAHRDESGILFVEHHATAVYCVSDPRLRGAGAVVVTTGAREALTNKQLHLVLRHEWAHLRSRHDRLVLRSHSLAEALPWLPFFRIAHDQIAELVELHADDAVATRDRPDLAGALYRLAGGSPLNEPAGSLSATGPAALARVGRLVRPPAPLRRSGAALVAAAIVATAVAPVTLAVLPAGNGISHHCCDPFGQAVSFIGDA
ncbi:hypothetical protein ASG90_17190 [Nocardioides sp. Soil797]|nr:hypothetical protein ASG90_17190 [Nocardioides sp. Soil797]